MIVSLIAALLILPQTGGTTPAPSTAPSTAATPAAEKPICRRETTTSSNLTKRVCHSRAEWAAINASNAANTDMALRARQGSGAMNRND